METLKVNFAEEQAYELALQYFIQTSGVTGKKEKHKRMMQEAMKVRENGLDGIQIRAEILYWGPEHYKGHKIELGGSRLVCPAFQQIDDSQVRGIYFYIITSGECRASDENIMELLYADIWGTAYVDAGRDLLQDCLREDLKMRNTTEKEYTLSDGFGPGFYGMKMAATRDIYGLFEESTAGVDLRETGIMVPLKSCIGLYLIVEKEALMPGEECRNCIGNSKGCSFCRIKNNRKYENRQDKEKGWVEL